MNITLTVVTCRRDKEQFLGLAQSVQRHSQSAPMLVIINDDKELLHELQPQVPLHWKFMHWTDVDSEWSNVVDWWSQQYFKIMVSRYISTEWYLLLDSDHRFKSRFRELDFLRNGRAGTRMMPWVSNEHDHDPHYHARLERAFLHLKVASRPRHHMTNLTPFMVHTKSMCELSHMIDRDWLDGNPYTSTYEFFLYYAYLVRSDRVNSLYSGAVPAPSKFIINTRT